MSALPFLVEYGGVVWRVLVAGSAIGAIAARRAIGSRRARRETAAELAERVKGVTAPVEGETSVRGTLKGGGAATLVTTRFDERTIEADAQSSRETIDADAQSGAPWLECDGERVELTGPLRVALGSEVERSRGLPKATPDALRAGKVEGAVHYRLASLKAGDVVIAHGKLARIAGEGGDYRAPASAWRMTPVDMTIELAAASPASRPPAVGMVGHVVTALLAGCAMLGALWIVGKAALPPDRRELASLDPALPAWDRVAIAAATPWNRNDALWEIEHRLEYDVVEDAVSREQHRALARLRDGCRGELGELRRQERLEDELAVADACGDAGDAAEALVLLGRYDEAADRVRPVWDRRAEVLATIGAGRWRDAADAIERPEPEADDARVDRAVMVDNRSRCLGQLMRLWAGDADAAGRLHELAKPGDTYCAIVDAFAAPTQADTAKQLAKISTDATVDALLQPLAWSQGAVLPENDWAVSTTGAIGINTHADRTPAIALLAPLVIESHQLAPGSREYVTAHVWLSSLAAMHGDFEHARQEAKLAAGSDDAQLDYPGMEGLAMLDSLALRTGGTPPYGPDTHPGQHPFVEPGVAARAHAGARASHMLFFRPEACEPQGEPALAAAAAGDGEPLADLMTRCRLSWNANFAELFGALGNVQRGRERLAARFRFVHDDLDLWLGTEAPWNAMHQLVLHRDLARLLGDTAEAQRDQQILDRHLAALSDRKRLIGIILWDLL